MLQRFSLYNLFYSLGRSKDMKQCTNCVMASSGVTLLLKDAVTISLCKMERGCDNLLVQDELLLQYQKRLECKPGLPVDLFGMSAIRDILFEKCSMVSVRTGLTGNLWQHLAIKPPSN